MAELPTKEQLEKLYYEKGHDALVWYAWRNALRALPLFGGFPLERVWGKDAIRHIYVVCRASLVLAQLVTSDRVLTYAAFASSQGALNAGHVARDSGASTFAITLSARIADTAAYAAATYSDDYAAAFNSARAAADVFIAYD